MVLGVIVVIAVCIGVAVFASEQRKKRIAEYAAWAGHRGWNYVPEDDSYTTFSALAPFDTGHSRGASDIFSGALHGEGFVAFEYKYSVTSGSGDNRKTRTYTYFVAGISTPPTSTTLTVSREGFLRGLRDAIGGRDLQLESVEFNNTFKVHGNNDRFAYDVLNPQTMERLLADPRSDWPLRYEQGRLLTWSKRKLDVSMIDPVIAYLAENRRAVPDYAWEHG